ncbi:MAG: hypothetical protein JOZ52_01400, partial [Acidobacteria bacterium]|nr:hypothetical protein [Acidobacteriota bacterium]
MTEQEDKREQSPEHQRALITGASGAIGQAIALSLAGQGFEVWLGCRSRVSEATELRDKIL